MCKRVISLFLAVAMIFCFVPLSVFADEHQHTFENKHGYDLSDLPDGYSIPFTIYEAPCSGNCGYSEYSWNVFGVSGQFVDKTGTSGLNVYKHYTEWFESVYGKNATATKFTPGGGSTDGSGVGRRPAGYSDDNGTPSVDSSGYLSFVVEPYGLGGDYSEGFTTSTPDSSYFIPGASASGTRFPYDNETIVYRFTAPANGVYFVGSLNGKVNYGYISIFANNDWRQKNVVYSYSNKYQFSKSLNQGDNLYFYLHTGYYHYIGSTKYNPMYLPYKFSLNSLRIFYEPLGDSGITNYNNITISNNTWNGNIYVDSSNNLTYIYPQYTTINENNETVTNISTNPIIYNNETKQYYTYDSVTNNYYYITYETTPTPTPSPSPAPAPTWTPGGGATRGGGVGRHPSDTDAADWTLHYYILNNRRYDAYYALKKTEVDTETKLPWVDNKKYISTTQIPIANGQYTVSVPDGVYWRVWSWDEASQTLTGVNSSNWHSTINNFLFNATGEYIFEFCKADGSDFNTAKDVTLKLKNDKITDYEDGGTIVEEPTPSPSPEPTETPSPTEPPIPTATPTPGGGTVPTPGGGTSGGNSGNGSNISGGDDEGLFGWLWDLLKDLVKAILKAIFKVLSGILGFLIWLVERVGLLFLFLPAPAVAALGAGVVLVFVIKIIRFIRG